MNKNSSLSMSKIKNIDKLDIALDKSVNEVDEFLDVKIKISAKMRNLLVRFIVPGSETDFSLPSSNGSVVKRYKIKSYVKNSFYFGDWASLLFSKDLLNNKVVTVKLVDQKAFERLADQFSQLNNMISTMINTDKDEKVRISYKVVLSED